MPTEEWGADWLYQEIVDLGWHPFLRINHQNYYCRGDNASWQPRANILTDKNQSWSGQVTCFKKNRLTCTLLAHWGEDYTDPWLMRGQSPLAARRRSARMRCTDLNPSQADVSWYQLPCWIESSYRDLKSDGFDWHKTRLRHPDRAERHWLAQSLRLRSSSAERMLHRLRSRLVTLRVTHDWGSFASRSVAMFSMVTQEWRTRDFT